MKTNESGRSMIEMLGVLAIIGVLSVGGLAGYAKAMSKFKVNKTLDQVTQIVAGTRALFAGHKDYSALKSDTPNYKLIQKGHLVPEEMMILDSNGALTGIESVYAYPVKILSAIKRSNDSSQKAFIITYEGVPQDSCVEMATQNWGSGSSAGLVGVCVNKTDMSGVVLGAASTCSGSGENTQGCCVVSKTMSVGEASAACRLPENTVSWKFF